MPKEKNNFRTRLETFVSKIKEAKSTYNPMTAKKLKAEIEAEIEPLGFEFVGMVEKLEFQNEDLQRQIGLLDERLSQAGY